MNIQAHDTTGVFQYELVFGQKPRAVLFTSGNSSKPHQEEDFERDGIHIEELQEEEVPDENDRLQQESEEQGGTGDNESRKRLNENGCEEQGVQGTRGNNYRTVTGAKR